ncbi:hypothetical protein OH491_13550 [Termitidicoccus mucosus]|uniref:Uncharacterized protein n=1 Tax=Termitidicoccus mucosus TaxID=1184151 RepID=A0A178IJI0_9BACT|nr:hypothetical protein AW736_13895 [Opitutaceae bacterium TSB47]
MSRWIPITLENLHESRTAKLVEPLRTKVLAEGQPDPLPPAITRTVVEIRAAIAFSGKYRVDRDAAKIPASLLDLAVLAVVRKLKGRALMPLNDTEKEDERTYQKRLEQLNAGKWPVEIADDPEPGPVVQSGGGSQVISSASRPLTGESLSGL